MHQLNFHAMDDFGYLQPSPIRQLMILGRAPRRLKLLKMTFGRRPRRFMRLFIAMALVSIFLLISSHHAPPKSNHNLHYTPTMQTSSFVRRQLSHNSGLQQPIQNPEAVISDPFYSLVPPTNGTAQERIAWMKGNLGLFDIFKSDATTRKFNARVLDFFNRSECSVRFFMTWIAPALDFGDRHLLGIESLFKSNPDACLVIVSKTMDRSELLEPFTARGFSVVAVGPDLTYLFRKTPVQGWFDRLRNGNIDPGEIPLAQNLSNLMRLALLYKYGGIYLDTDFIVLKNFRGLRNSIGAQSVDLVSGNWTRLNNAAMVFDRHHPILKKFMEEFATTFNGSRWGHNGPYLVSRLVKRAQRERRKRGGNLDLTVLPPMAFYPVGWSRIGGLFEEPRTLSSKKWVALKVAQLKQRSYGVHLWNKQSRRIETEEGSVVDTLTSELCIVCSRRRPHQR